MNIHILDKINQDVCEKANQRQGEVVECLTNNILCTCKDNNQFFVNLRRLSNLLYEISVINNRTDDYYRRLVGQLKFTRRQMKSCRLCLHCTIQYEMRDRNYIGIKKGFLDV